MDTIYALSSGLPPAGIGIIRISGPSASAALQALAGRVPEPRRASYASFKDPDGLLLDKGLMLFFPGPKTATGEDLAELHCHGGRAVIFAIQSALASLEGLRAATPGEFTRRAFANGVVDLAEAEGLGDLLSAETELQRRSAMTMAEGHLSRRCESWRKSILSLSAQVEAVLDFSDEEDVEELSPSFEQECEGLASEFREWLEKPSAERLKDGVRVVLAGPPNAGKSSLFNLLTDSEAAIITPIAGTTRDVLERPVALSGTPIIFMDTAGLHESSRDEVEIIGIARAQHALSQADIVLWLGTEGEGPQGAIEVESYADVPDRTRKGSACHLVSGKTGSGVDALKAAIVAIARQMLPNPGEVALNARQRQRIEEAHRSMMRAREALDLLVLAEELRQVRVSLDGLIGRTSTEDMLDGLFGSFCIGK
ncbi:tRNA uridine-5-carboxymethylaminomethyl(34) synthesis GTPase MnmE [Altererythrobacter sp. SALINAS58]|uniref:tRNA uridine-5-carboxymethylaminomethyl(34) synthesis GTPase MnmE n=1 Tax=Alteripontixanthobacter muriae TaxID=2705546 RepID=UPI0015766ABC|nr:tRNA uridine-5-carboxymethylaminomethyl(34) synthesis GTPase MnmE [Alteripontixanthobacter muriae]NTZ43526.1 tRNA uridine-5-carboxymethylaminomethyl(34) synthesis GTPase MnmE [Alteripontixanthobacter muriae]